MASSEEFKDFVLEQLYLSANSHFFRARKMFGEYCIYMDNFPIFLLCDNVVYVKKLPKLRTFLQSSAKPFAKAKMWFIVDVENQKLLARIIKIVSEERVCKE